MTKPSILVVDDDVFFRAFCTDVLRSEGYAVGTASSAEEALAVLRAEGAALLLVDIYMPGKSGLELLESVKASCSGVDIIIMTGHGSIETAVQALKRGAADYLRKPFAAQELAAVVEATLAQRRLYEENGRLRRQLEIYEISRSFAVLDDPQRVLVLGLEALLRVTHCERGVALCSGADAQFMALCHSRGLTEGEAASLRQGLLTQGLRYLKGLDGVQVLGGARLAKVAGGDGFGGAGEAMLVPVAHRGSVEAAFVLLRPARGRRFAEDEVVNARFLGRQVEVSYESSLRIHDARKLAYVDTLTDLYNARYLEVALDRHIEEVDRAGGSFGVLFLDLDYFKEVNDAFGHQTGGKVLIEVGRILKASVREEDTVVRFGGDEFTVLLPRTDRRGALDVAERIRRGIKAHAFLGREGRSIRLTASIGVATCPGDGRTREALIDQADRAMYRGKETTRDVVTAADS